MATLALAKKNKKSPFFPRLEEALTDIITSTWLISVFVNHFDANSSIQDRIICLDKSYNDALAILQMIENGEQIGRDKLNSMRSHGVNSFANAIPPFNPSELFRFDNKISRYLVSDPSAMMLPLAYSDLASESFRKTIVDLDVAVNQRSREGV